MYAGLSRACPEDERGWQGRGHGMGSSKGRQGMARPISAPTRRGSPCVPLTRRLSSPSPSPPWSCPPERGRHPTPGVTPKRLGRGTFSERVKVDASNIKAKIKPSDFVVLSPHFAPGGMTGWHSHPGPAMVIVQRAPSPCNNAATARRLLNRYGAWEAFAHKGGGSAQMAATRPASRCALVTFVILIGAAPTIDAPIWSPYLRPNPAKQATSPTMDGLQAR